MPWHLRGRTEWPTFPPGTDRPFIEFDYVEPDGEAGLQTLSREQLRDLWERSDPEARRTNPLFDDFWTDEGIEYLTGEPWWTGRGAGTSSLDLHSLDEAERLAEIEASREPEPVGPGIEDIRRDWTEMAGPRDSGPVFVIEDPPGVLTLTNRPDDPRDARWVRARY